MSYRVDWLLWLYNQKRERKLTSPLSINELTSPLPINELTSPLNQWANKSSLNQWANKSSLNQWANKSSLNQWANKSSPNQWANKSSPNQWAKKSSPNHKVFHASCKLSYIDEKLGLVANQIEELFHFYLILYLASFLVDEREIEHRNGRPYHRRQVLQVRCWRNHWCYILETRGLFIRWSG